MKENRTTEYKSDVSNSFLKTVSAFANFNDGKIIFGITDQGNICGVDDPKQACLDIEHRINDSISPKPEYSLAVDGDTNVVTLMVSEGSFKPYLYKGKAYRRSDTSTVEVDTIELKRLILEGTNKTYEELPASSQDLTFNYLENKLGERLGISNLSKDILRTLGFYTKDNTFNIAAELMSDQNPMSGIDVARFGNDISIIQDRELFAGESILKQFEDAVIFFSRYYIFEKIDGISRRTVELIPSEAFREALANALIHRTWDVKAHIRIEMYQDSIRIVSPGGLPSALSPEEYLSGNISYLRNPIIANLFYRMHYIEMFGTGIRRIKEAYASSTTKPDFQIFENSISITLPVISSQYNVSVDENKVLELLQHGIQLSSREIADRLGWSKDKALRTLNALKQQSYVRTVGKGRSTNYALK